MKQLVALLVASSAFCVAHSQAQRVSVYLSAPNVQTATDSGYTTAQTEGFTSISATSSGTAFPSPYVSTGITQTPTTFTSTGSVNVFASGTTGESQYGGYNQGNFVALSSGAATTLTISFATPVSYLGFLLPAADSDGTVQLFGANNAFIGTFSTANLLTMLRGQSTQTSIDGTQTYSSSSYFGQPTTGFDSSEPYGYLSFIASGTTISRAVFNENSVYGASMELDNFSVVSGTPSPVGSSVLVASVPEPSTWALLLTAAGAIGWTTVRRRHKLAA